MKGQPIRKLFAFGVIAVTVVALIVALVVTNLVLEVGERLQQWSPIAIGVFTVTLLAVGLAGGWLTWSLLKGGKKSSATRKAANTAPEDPVAFEALLNQRTEQGVDTAAIKNQLEHWKNEHAGRLSIGFCGRISAGKSSLINALIPTANVTVDVRGGSTTTASVHRYAAVSGDVIELIDLPGFGDKMDENVRDQAVRCHVLVYATDSDLTRSDYEQAQALTTLGKPMVLVLTKSDQLSQQQQEQLLSQLAQRAEKLGAFSVVRASVDRSEDGQHSLDQLLAVLQQAAETDSKAINAMRDRSILLHLRHQLDTTTDAFRQSQSGQLVDRYSRRAVLGALAAVSPGSDLVIQGALAASLVKSLCELYEVPYKSIDLDRFVSLATAKLGRSTTITLAVAGNALKAFPGIGTVAGGLVHAVCYGMIFDSMGRAVSKILHERGQLEPKPTAQAFEDELIETLRTRSGRLARLALEVTREKREKS